MTSARAQRPVGVTILIVLLWIQALVSIAGGVALILLHKNHSLVHDAHASSSTLLAYGIGVLIVGVVTALIASALGRGSDFARWVVGLISILQLAGSVYGVVHFHGGSRTGAIVNGVIALIILYVLFGERGSRRICTGRK